LKKDLWKGIRKKEKRKWKQERKERIGGKRFNEDNEREV
jgi:hypothetical protein